MIITIDGPTASGKSTIARLLAKQLGIYYLGTGLLFRGFAYLLLEQKAYGDDDLHNPRQEDIAFYIDSDRFTYQCDQSCDGRVFFDGIDLTPFLKTSRIDAAASILSANQMVRTALLVIQRACGAIADIVTEGRDVGSVVFPHADVKFFLTADTSVRAERWKEHQKKKGNVFSLSEAIDNITARDKRDSERVCAPLIQPEGAILVDNSKLNLQETLDLMMKLIKKAR